MAENPLLDSLRAARSARRQRSQDGEAPNREPVQAARCARVVWRRRVAEPQNVSERFTSWVVGCGRREGRPHPISPR